MWFFVVFVVVAGVAVGVKLWSAKKRRDTFQALATARNWTFVAEDDSLVTQWNGAPFGRGDNPRARNAVTGVHDGRPFVAFDYSYETTSTSTSSSGSSTDTHEYSICALALTGPLPRLEVTRESLLFGKLGTAMGMQDHEVDDDTFNRRYRIRTQDPEFAMEVLQPETIQTLLAADFGAWRIADSSIMSWEKGKHKPAEMDARFAVLDAVLDSIPPELWKNAG
jgi:hypothetical protein